MLSFEEALKIAKGIKPNVNCYMEFEGAYAFCYDSGEGTKGGEGTPFVISKADGAVTWDFIRHAMRDKIIREFTDIEQFKQTT